MSAQDEVTVTREIYKTTNYDQFRLLEGNRIRKESDIKVFAKVLQDEGNLMDLFPIEVNEEMYVIDGQKRLGAAKLNGMPVYYAILPNTNVDTVIARNSNTQNWTWLEFAQSWAARKNEHYIHFLELYEKFRYNYNVLMRYYIIGPAFINSSRSEHWTGFRKGDFKINDFTLTRKLLSQCQELLEESDIEKITRDFANAAYGFIRKPKYDHERMISQMQKYGTDFSHCFFQSDYLKEFEKIEQAV